MNGLYKVSNLGRVKSIFRYKKILKLHFDKDGYSYVRLYKNKKSFNKLVHRLVAEAFIPNPKNKPQVNHKDFNRSNNVLTNLEWCTGQENIDFSNNKGRYNGKGIRTIYQYDANGNFIKQWESLTEASKTLNIDLSNICRCCANGKPLAGGYLWKYA